MNAFETRDSRLPKPVRDRGYRNVEGLGGHEFSETFRVRNDGGDPLVVKLLDVRQIETWKQLELFERQTETLESLDHPSIPEYVESFQFELDGVSACGLVCEYVEGTSLDELLDEGRQWGEEEIREFLDDMLDVLEYLHGFTPPVVHRDIKPSNILRTDDGDYVLIDFGSVQTVLAGETGGTTFVGTNGYMPPEQMMGRAVAASDLYALGATAVYMLSGIEPRRLTADGVELEFEDHIEVSTSLEQILGRLVEPRLELRLEDAAAVRRALRGDRLPDRGHFGGWEEPPAKMTTNCRVEGQFIELEQQVAPKETRRGRVWTSAVLGPIPLVLGWVFQFEEIGAGPALVKTVGIGYGLMIPVALWFVLRRRWRERLEVYLGATRRRAMMVMAIAVPWYFVTLILMDFLDDRTEARCERMTIGPERVVWRQLTGGGGELDSVEFDRGGIEAVAIDKKDIRIEISDRSIVFDTARCTPEERRWLREGLQWELT